MNAVSPGRTVTPGLEGRAKEGDLRDFYNYLAGWVPSINAQALEIAKMVAFLASDEASYVNGADVQVDRAHAALTLHYHGPKGPHFEFKRRV